MRLIELGVAGEAYVRWRLEKFGDTMAEMALRWTLCHPAVSTVIPGMRKRRHVDANCGVSDGAGLPADLLEQLRAHRWDRVPTPWSQ